jgi:hypothetical protein
MGRIFQIKESRRTRLCSHLPGEGGFPHLPGSDQTDNRRTLQGRDHAPEMALSGNHPAEFIVKINHLMVVFHEI